MSVCVSTPDAWLMCMLQNSGKCTPPPQGYDIGWALWGKYPPPPTTTYFEVGKINKACFRRHLAGLRRCVGVGRQGA